ncbi:hypothetical protein KIPB_000063 [Kipferlia bialata]|uniref:Uncharacterized protein n=1 Tax=Kipferlia bialata TaxID=797122 RepID=A0A9K3CNE9_9EUKA|nr:hypothetical protein KIPB_000063 [Kipferlia bialata]|eukprot:g63.t1
MAGVDVDNIICMQLASIGAPTPESGYIDDFDGGLLYEACAKCLNCIEDKGILAVLPPEGRLGPRLRAASALGVMHILHLASQTTKARVQDVTVPLPTMDGLATQADAELIRMMNEPLSDMLSHSQATGSTPMFGSTPGRTNVDTGGSQFGGATTIMDQLYDMEIDAFGDYDDMTEKSVDQSDGDILGGLDSQEGVIGLAGGVVGKPRLNLLPGATPDSVQAMEEARSLSVHSTRSEVRASDMELDSTDMDLPPLVDMDMGMQGYDDMAMDTDLGMTDMPSGVTGLMESPLRQATGMEATDSEETTDLRNTSSLGLRTDISFEDAPQKKRKAVADRTAKDKKAKDIERL